MALIALIGANEVLPDGGLRALVTVAGETLIERQAVRLADGTEGVAQGVGPGGELRVHTPAGLREVHSAEVSVRPQAPQGGG